MLDISYLLEFEPTSGDRSYQCITSERLVEIHTCNVPGSARAIGTKLQVLGIAQRPVAELPQGRLPHLVRRDELAHDGARRQQRPVHGRHQTQYLVHLRLDYQGPSALLTPEPCFILYIKQSLIELRFPNRLQAGRLCPSARVPHTPCSCAPLPKCPLS